MAEPVTRQVLVPTKLVAFVSACCSAPISAGISQATYGPSWGRVVLNETLNDKTPDVTDQVTIEDACESCRTKLVMLERSMPRPSGEAVVKESAGVVKVVTNGVAEQYSGCMAEHHEPMGRVIVYKAPA